MARVRRARQPCEENEQEPAAPPVPDADAANDDSTQAAEEEPVERAESQGGGKPTHAPLTCVKCGCVEEIISDSGEDSGEESGGTAGFNLLKAYHASKVVRNSLRNVLREIKKPNATQAKRKHDEPCGAGGSCAGQAKEEDDGEPSGADKCQRAGQDKSRCKRAGYHIVEEDEDDVRDKSGALLCYKRCPCGKFKWK